MNDFIQAVQSIVRAIFEFFHLGYSMAQPPPRDPLLKAEFEKDQKILSVFNEGFCIDGKRSLSLKDSFRHAIIIGKSGIGKSTATFISSLLTMTTSACSFVIHDPSKELFTVCAGFLKAQGYHVIVLDFADALRSIGFNALEKIKNESDADLIAGMLVRTTLKSSDPFWDTSATQLIKSVILLVLRLSPEYHNLPNVLHVVKMVTGNRSRFNEIVAKYADDKLYLDFAAILANDPKVLSGITATSAAALSIFSQENVALVTSKDTLNFSMLRKRKTALFVQNQVSSMAHYNPIISLFFEMFFSSLLQDTAFTIIKNIICRNRKS